jgi:hypothetical protein
MIRCNSRRSLAVGKTEKANLVCSTRDGASRVARGSTAEAKKADLVGGARDGASGVTSVRATEADQAEAKTRVGSAGGRLGARAGDGEETALRQLIGVVLRGLLEDVTVGELGRVDLGGGTRRVGEGARVDRGSAGRSTGVAERWAVWHSVGGRRDGASKGRREAARSDSESDERWRETHTDCL